MSGDHARQQPPLDYGLLLEEEAPLARKSSRRGWILEDLEQELTELGIPLGNPPGLDPSGQRRDVDSFLPPIFAPCFCGCVLRSKSVLNSRPSSATSRATTPKIPESGPTMAQPPTRFATPSGFHTTPQTGSPAPPSGRRSQAPRNPPTIRQLVPLPVWPQPFHFTIPKTNPPRVHNPPIECLGSSFPRWRKKKQSSLPSPSPIFDPLKIKCSI